MIFDYTKEPGKVLKKEYVKGPIDKLVSVITPFFNAGKYFEQTFNCVINQSFPWFEWIIVNDGSTNSADVARLNELAENDSRITVINQDNCGSAVARNKGINTATTDLIIFLDADDLIEPEYFEQLYFGLFFNKDYDVAYTNSIGFDGQEYVWNYGFDAEKLKTYNFLNYTGIFRKKALLDVGGYSEDEKLCFEDWNLWLKLLANKSAILRETQYGFWYRRSETGNLGQIQCDKRLRKNAEKQIADTAATFDSSKVVFKDYNKTHGFGEFAKPSYFEWNYVIKSDKTHILMLFPWMQMGGADRFNLELVTGLDRNKYDITIVTTKPDTNVWIQKFRDVCDEIYCLPDFLDVKDFSGFISYLIKSRNVQIVFNSHSYYGYYIMPWIRMHFPRIALLDYTHLEELYWRGGGYARNSGTFSWVLDRSYTCNELTRKVFIQKYGADEDRTKTIYIGTDTEVFCPSGEKANLPFASDKKIVLYPCRLTEQKRPYLMLEIAKMVHKQNPEVVFVSVGNGPLLDNVKKAARRNNMESYVCFLGEQDNMSQFYRAANITLICSIKEGLALTAYESMACGVPVVSADVGGQSELIDNEVGRLIPLLQDEDTCYRAMLPLEEEALLYSGAIIDLLSNDKEYARLCKNSRDKVEKDFSFKQMISEFDREFELVLGDDKMEKRETLAKVLMSIEPLVTDYLLLFNEYMLYEEKDATSRLGRIRTRIGNFLKSPLGNKIYGCLKKMSVI